MRSAGGRARLTEAQKALVEGGHKLVERLARFWVFKRRAALSYEDFVSLGNVGLVEAALSFDPAVGTPFETFAWGRVFGAMRDGIKKEMRAVRPRTEERAETTYLAAPHPEGDVFTDTDEDCQGRVHKFADGFAAGWCFGVGAATRRAIETTEEARADEAGYARAVAVLAQATATMPERDQTILRLHYVEERELTHVAEAMGTSYGSIRRFHRDAIDRLASRMRARGVTAAVLEHA